MKNNEFKSVYIKNRTFYYYDDEIIKLGHFNINDILIDKKSDENILIYNMSYRTLIDSKPLQIRFLKLHGIIRIYDGIRHLTLFG